MKNIEINEIIRKKLNKMRELVKKIGKILIDVVVLVITFSIILILLLVLNSYIDWFDYELFGARMVFYILSYIITIWLMNIFKLWTSDIKFW